MSLHLSSPLKTALTPPSAEVWSPFRKEREDASR